jgi:2-dehydro-3-deoxyphosphogalactonate aldolase
MNLGQLLARDEAPIVAILRGIEPSQVEGVGRALFEAGIRIIEVSLNSPQALLSIERLSASLPADVLVGAGTVTSAQAADAVDAAGGRLVVAPNTDTAVIARCVELGLDVMPGVMTPTDAFAAYAAGARHLKLFPASSSGTQHLKALLEVLPRGCRIWAVGGTDAVNFAGWLGAGAAGIGVGGALYRAGDSLATVAANVGALMAAWRAARKS